MDMRHAAATAGFMALIAWTLYRRFKRTVGFQKLNRSRLMFRAVLFGILGCFILYLGILHPVSMAADAAGLVAGLVLSFYAIKHLRFEKREDGWYYRTHLWIEVAVLVLFLSRIVYRLLAVYMEGSGMIPGAGTASAPGSDPQAMFKDPLTAGIFFVLIAYYVRYFVFLLRKDKELGADTQAS